MTTRLPTLLLALAWTPAAMALPLYDASDAALSPDTCKAMTDSGEGVWQQFGSRIEDRVHVYLALDFADEYGAGVGRSVTSDQARQMLLDAMEVWNRESRGPVYVFAGDTKAGLQDNRDLTVTCDDFSQTGGPDGEPIQTPAILVAGWRESSALAGVWTVVGSDGQVCHEQPDFTGFVGLNVQRPNLDQLEPVFIHELGHGLGLEHSFGADETALGTPMSVMAYPAQVNDYDNSSGEVDVGNSADRQGWRNHLWPWDIDCVDDDLAPGAGKQDARARQVIPRWRTYIGTDEQWSPDLGATWTRTSKAATAAGGLDLASEGGVVYPVLGMDTKYGLPALLWASDSIDTGAAVDGILELDEEAVVLDALDVVFAPIAPLLWTSHEAKTSVLDDASMAWPDLPRDGGPPDHAGVGVMDPPPMRVVLTDVLGEVAVDTELLSCPVSGPCDVSAVEPVATHVALRAAWNPEAAGTLYATVTTRDCVRDATNRDPNSRLFARTVDDAVDRCGGIRLHPGEGPSVWGGTILAAPRTLVAAPSADLGTVLVKLPGYDTPLGSETYEYSGTTDVAPAVACGPKLGALDDANCIVAWVDSGTPDHHVLVAHFETVGGEIVFDGEAYVVEPEVLSHRDAWGDEVGTIKTPGGLTSASDLSAAWSDDRFWISLKGTRLGYEDTVQVVHTTDGQVDRWEEWVVFAEDHTVDAPSLVFDPLDPQAELGLVWTTLD